VRFEFAESSPVEDIFHSSGIVIRTAAALEIARRGKQNQLFRMRHRERAEHDLVHQRKDGGVDADAESQRQHDNQAKQWSFRQASEGKAYAAHVSLPIYFKTRPGF